MEKKILFYGPSLYMCWIIFSLLHLTAFFQGEDKSIERGEKNIINRGMWRASVMPMGRFSVLSTPVAGSVTSHTRRVVFLIVFLYSF